MALAGMTICFTGKLSMTRAEAKAMAEAAGAKVTAAISGKTDVVVCGDKAGDTSKDDKIGELGIDTWDEELFVQNCQKKKAAKAPKAPKAKAAPPPKQAGKKKAADAEEEAEPAAATPEPPKKAAAKEAPKPAPAAAAAAAPSGGGGGKPVDREVPDRGSYRVVDDYSVTLNQTNIGGNNNKYYIIQLLEGKGQYHAWNRWGRVGEPGQHKLESFPGLAGAKASFEKKFKDKSMNAWSQRANFVPHEGKYTLVEMDEKEGADAAGGDASAPMGKLSKAQIEKGQGVLIDITNAIEMKRPNKEIVDLSSLFFTLIPTNFGRRVPQPLTTLDQVKEKEELLKFYLRMGFEEVDKGDTKASPLAGVLEIPVPPTLHDAVSNACGVPDINKSVSQGDQLAKKRAGAPVGPMTKEHYGSILLYTGNAIYRTLNQALRSENRLEIDKWRRYLRLLFAAADMLPKKSLTLWRGLSVDVSKDYTVGRTITWWGVSSCTSDQQVAKNFMAGCGGDCSFLTIETKTAVDIAALSFYSNEKESLLMPGTMLRVKSVNKNGRVAEIHLEEVGRAGN